MQARLGEAGIRARLMMAELRRLERMAPSGVSARLVASHTALTCSVSPLALETARRATVREGRR